MINKLNKLKIKLKFNNLIDRINFGYSYKFKISFEKELKGFFPSGGKFYLVQVGANDGKNFDFLFDFIQSRDSFGVLIEPIKEYYDELVENYKNFQNIKLINKAVHQTQEKILLYKLNPIYKNLLPLWAKGIASVDKEHYKKSKISSEYITSEIVESDHLMNILHTNYYWERIDLFQIDVEGFDLEVLKMYDFKWIRPKFIKFEYFNLSEEDLLEAFNLLKNNNYQCSKIDGDVICVDTTL